MGTKVRMFARTESKASRTRNACGPPSWSTIAIILFIFASSWLHPRPRRHYEGIRFLQFVAQLSSGVMHEDVVERGILHGQRLHRYFTAHRHFDQFGRGARAVAGEYAIHARAFMLHGSNFVERAQALLPIGGSIV